MTTLRPLRLLDRWNAALLLCGLAFGLVACKEPPPRPTSAPFAWSSDASAGIASCGVTYGFQPETLAVAGPDYLIDRMEQLLDVLAGPFVQPDNVIM